MNEEYKNPDQEAAAAQFDAQAAEEARRFLEEGVNRNKQGEIIDTVGGSRPYSGRPQTLDGVARDIYHDYKYNAETADYFREQESLLKKRGEDANANASKVEERGHSSVYQREEANRSFWAEQYAKKEGRDAEHRRDKNLKHATQHYQENQAGYVAQAVENANTAGHDINLGGYNYPAQPLEQQNKQSHQEIDESPTSAV